MSDGIRLTIPKGYSSLLNDIKQRIKTSQIKAVLAVNQELINLYWEIGKMIASRLDNDGWGVKIVDKLSDDIRKGFPNLKGFSSRNLNYMLKFARTYQDAEFLQQPVAKIPWGHNIVLLEKLDNLRVRLWYAHKTIENGWSRRVLETWIESDLYKRQGQAITNFQRTLPSPQSDLALQILKDPYNFDFLELREKYDEKELEDGLLEHIQKFLIEFGSGFAFVGRQYRIEVDEKEYFLDLLFYHLKLRCYCVIELKTREFKPEHVGKINFYLSAVDDLLRHPSDNPTIGILLCKNKRKLTVECALRDMHKPIGVSGYEVNILESLPEDFKGSLPAIEEIEQELDRQGGS